MLRDLLKLVKEGKRPPSFRERYAARVEQKAVERAALDGIVARRDQGGN